MTQDQYDQARRSGDVVPEAEDAATTDAARPTAAAHDAEAPA